MPYIFAWFTLRKGYSLEAKIGSFSYLIIIMLIISVSNNTPSNNVNTNTPVSKAQPVKTQEQIEKERIAGYENSILIRKNKIIKINENLDIYLSYKKYENNLVTFEINSCLDQIRAASILVIEDFKGDDDYNKMLAKLKTKLPKVQEHLFPILRKSYAKILKKKLYDSDIDVNANGSKSKILAFTGVIFYANRNKTAFLSELDDDIVKRLRFKRIELRGTKYDDEYTFLDIKDVKNDKDVYKTKK